MAYDDLTNDQLIGEIYDRANQLENMAQAVMRRVIELKARTAVAVPPVPDPLPEPEPVEPPPPPIPAPGEPISGWVLASTVEPFSRFSSEADLFPLLRATAIAPDMANDSVGAFRLNERPHMAKLVDPFFYPGQFPVNHDHTHYGYRGVDENSTHASLVRGDDYSVQFDGSAIWFPTLYAMDRNTGELRRSLNSTLIRYYKAVPDIEFWDEISARSPEFAARVAAMRPKTREWYEYHRLVELPDGLRFIAGVTNESAKHNLYKTNGKTYSARTFAEILPFMEVGDNLSIEVHSSPLWDATHIDSPDHHSHLAAIEYDNDYHEPIINPDFPKRLVVITLKAQHVLESWMDFSTLAISSDLQHNAEPGSTSHAEYAEAWDKTVKAVWHREAINGHRDCSSANLGNGYKLKFAPNIDPIAAPQRFPAGPPFVG